MRKTAFALIALMMLGALAAPAMAQDEDARISVDFNGEHLNTVLQMFKRGWGFEYTLGEGVDAEMPIYTNLRDVTLEQALSSITKPNGLLAVEQNGRYVIKERPEPQARDEQTRTVSPAFAAESRTPPAPSRAMRDYEPRRGEAEDGEDDEEERDEVMDIIYPLHLGADMASSIFGGDFIEAGGYFGGGGGYGGGSRGGYGGSSGYGSNRGSSGFGSNRGSSGFGSNRGGSSFGSNRGGSSFGSNRGGSSFGNNRNF
ncbi:MAG: hypothetical protein GF393_11990 [Armatimonadia bacterium]|nr:hypothetical protein [Armatimonadia bacterium]